MVFTIQLKMQFFLIKKPHIANKATKEAFDELTGTLGSSTTDLHSHCFLICFCVMNNHEAFWEYL